VASSSRAGLSVKPGGRATRAVWTWPPGTGPGVCPRDTARRDASLPVCPQGLARRDRSGGLSPGHAVSEGSAYRAPAAGRPSRVPVPRTWLVGTGPGVCPRVMAAQDASAESCPRDVSRPALGVGGSPGRLSGSSRRARRRARAAGRGRSGGPPSE
jgi:hypothetical protein